MFKLIPFHLYPALLLAAIFAVGLITPAVRAEELLFRSATVVDGTGAPAYRADVLVSGERIVRVGEVEAPEGARVIDASGRVLAPGFIDIHSHLDFQLLLQPEAENVVRQGVTTVMGGNCGFALAPRGEQASLLTAYLTALGVEGVSTEFSTLASYLASVEQTGTSVNLAMLAPQGMIREAVMGVREGEPTELEMARMKAMLDQAMRDGAFGLSTGLAYPPGYNSSTDELIELSRVLKPYHGIYASHIRDEGGKVLDSIAEAIRIGEEAGVGVQISHVKAIMFTNFGKVKKVLDLMAQARERGLDVWGDVYPYRANSTSMSAIILPPSVIQQGDAGAVMKSLADPAQRAQVKDFTVKRMSGMIPRTGALALVPESALIKVIQYYLGRTTAVEGVYGHPEYDGKRLYQIAKIRGHQGDVLDLCLDLLSESGHDITVISFTMSESDVRSALASPFIMIGSDGMGIARGGQHPRGFGAFPRVIARYVREEKLLTLEQAVHKMTGMSAARLGLADRGVIKEGNYADLVLFDPETIQDRADFEKTQEFPAGIDLVVVNGRVTVEGERHLGFRAGRVLRKCRPGSERPSP